MTGPQGQPSGPPNLLEVVGGPLGIAETSLPAVAFVVAYTASSSDTRISSIVAVGVALVLCISRLTRRESPRFAISGVIGVAFAAFVANKSGEARNYFLPGLLMNVGYASAFLISIAVRWPLVGVVVGQLDGEGYGWREDPVRLAAFARASWMWAGLFVFRLAVQAPLYFAGAVVALGVAKTAMGIPLFALGVWLSYRLVRRPTEDPRT